MKATLFALRLNELLCGGVRYHTALPVKNITGIILAHYQAGRNVHGSGAKQIAELRTFAGSAG
jgi:hypothetical protein